MIHNFDNRIDLKNIINIYLKEKYINVNLRFIDLKNSIKNLADIDDRVNSIIAKYEW